MGGSGVTIALVVAIFVFSKKQEDKMVAKLAAPIGIFNINEPMIFGIPIVLNPIYIIPFLIIPPICATIAYLATAVGIIPPVFIPSSLDNASGNIRLSNPTGGSIMAAIISLLNVFIAFVIWSGLLLLVIKQKVRV